MSPTAALITAFGVIFAALAALATARLTNKASPYKDMVDMVAKAHVRLDKQDTKIDVQEDQIDDLQVAKRQDRERIDRLEGDQDILVGELVLQDDWQGSGAAPPPPVIGSRARRLLRAHGVERRAERLDREKPETP